jgi:hypothetical protein
MKRTIHLLALPAWRRPWLCWAVVVCGALGSCWVRVALDPGIAP